MKIVLLGLLIFATIFTSGCSNPSADDCWAIGYLVGYGQYVGASEANIVDSIEKSGLDESDLSYCLKEHENDVRLGKGKALIDVRNGIRPKYVPDRGS